MKLLTSDTTLYYENFNQEILEWTDVLGVSSTPTTTTLDDPQANYTQTTYGEVVVAYSAPGVGHTVPVHESLDLIWFGITPGTIIPGSGSVSTTTTSTTSTTSTSTTTSSGSSGTGAAHYGQCGG